MCEHGVRPELEIFDLSHIDAARRLVDDGLMHVFSELKRVFPSATWTVSPDSVSSEHEVGFGARRRRNADRSGGQHLHQQGPPDGQQCRTRPVSGWYLRAS